MATLEEQYKARQDASQAKINSLYDDQLASTQAGLQSAYDQSNSDLEYAKSQIDPAYRKSANNMAANYERNKRNLNMQAMQNGLNTGTGSQQQLALNNTWSKNYSSLMSERAGKIAEADKGLADLKTNYQNQVAAAIADNDYKRAAALLDDYNNNQSWLETTAKNLAASGDFSGYALLYGQDQAAAMEKTWIAQNPDTAYRTGKITAEEYRKMTGSYPAGYSNPTTAKSYYTGDAYTGDGFGNPEDKAAKAAAQAAADKAQADGMKRTQQVNAAQLAAAMQAQKDANNRAQQIAAANGASTSTSTTTKQPGALYQAIRSLWTR